MRLTTNNSFKEKSVTADYKLVGISIDYTYMDGSRKYFAFETTSELLQMSISCVKKHGVTEEEKSEMTAMISETLYNSEYPSSEFIAICMEFVCAFDDYSLIDKADVKKDWSYHITINDRKSNKKLFAMELDEWYKLEEEYIENSKLYNNNFSLN